MEYSPNRLGQPPLRLVAFNKTERPKMSLSKSEETDDNKTAFAKAEKKSRDTITYFIELARKTGLNHNEKPVPISKLQFNDYLKQVREEVGDILQIEFSNMLLAASKMPHDDMSKYMRRFDTIRLLLLEAVYNSTIIVTIKESGGFSAGKSSSQVAELFGSTIKGGRNSGMN